MKKLLFLVLVISIITSLSCKKDKREDNLVYKNGAVVITFDDHYVDKWLMADTVLHKYNWKATFNLTLFNKRTEEEIQGLQYLESRGHEIAGHGLNHQNAIEYINAHSLDSYLKNEVDSLTFLMNQKFKRVKTFAFPNGSTNEELNAAMFQRFRILRGTTDKTINPIFQDCYYTGNHFIHAWGIDASYPHYSQALLTQLLEFAHQEGFILILYAHRPTREITIDYQVSISTLEYICKYVDDNGMEFLTMAELADL